MSCLLRAEAISKTYDTHMGWFRKQSRVALHNVSFELHEGKSLAVMGSNGSGKSTLAGIIAGAIAPTRGELFFQGSKLLTGDFKNRAQNIRMVFQDSEASLNPHRTIGKQLHEALLFNTKLTLAQRNDLITSTLLRVGLLDEHRVFYPYMMSNGQRQRACIARAIILNPKVLVADEALSNLDTSVRAQILNLLLDLQEDFKMSYIFITHSQEIAHHMADHVLVLKDGAVESYSQTTGAIEK